MFTNALSAQEIAQLGEEQTAKARQEGQKLTDDMIAKDQEHIQNDKLTRI